jgi:hypothetical protein
MKLIKILDDILLEYETVRFWEKHDLMLSEESKMFTELANPDNAYPYEEVSEYVWEFKDKYGNTLGVDFDQSSRFLSTYYKIKGVSGKIQKIFDYESNKDYIDPSSIKIGSDERRSDTICKIIRDELIPKFLLKRRMSFIKIHPISKYRSDIFWKCAEVCKEKYPELEIKLISPDIFIMNR